MLCIYRTNWTRLVLIVIWHINSYAPSCLSVGWTDGCPGWEVTLPALLSEHKLMCLLATEMVVLWCSRSRNESRNYTIPNFLYSTYVIKIGKYKKKCQKCGMKNYNSLKWPQNFSKTFVPSEGWWLESPSLRISRLERGREWA